MHSVFKIPSKSHMLDFVLISSVYYKCSYKLWFHSLKVFKYCQSIISCGTLIIKIKISICPCSIVSRVFIYASNKPLCGTLIINLGKNWVCVCYCKQIKTSLQESNKKYKICISNLSMANFHISAKTTEIKLLKFQQLMIYK